MAALCAAVRIHAQDQLQIAGSQQLEYSVDKKNNDRYFENWTQALLNYQSWRIGLRYEIHTPPQPFSQQKPGQGLFQRYIEYRRDGLTVTAGNYYAILGRGLVLRSYENRTLRWDTNIDGVKFDYKHRYVDVQALGGRPRDLTGRRYESLQGGDLRLKPWKSWHVGGTYLVTDLAGRGTMQAGSGYSQLTFKPVTVYAEIARREHPDSRRDGWAKYAAATVFIEDLSVALEGKDYDQFDLTEGVTYNNPPSVVREHLYTLLNRHQLVVNANDERGFLIEAIYPVLETGIATANYSYTENHGGRKLYQEIYGQFEWDYPEHWQWVWAGGRQEDLEARYLNAVVSASWQFTESNALKAVVEHQHARVKLTDRQFYSQIGLLSFSRAKRFTVALIGEHTTDHQSKQKNWFGVQTDVQFWEKYDVTVFAGSRREGKICAGGVCVQKPEFEGVELALLAKF